MMLGMPGNMPETPAEPEPEPDAEAKPSPQAQRVAGTARTMIGMPAPQSAQIQEAVAQAKRAAAAKETARRERETEPDSIESDQAKPPPRRAPVGPSQRTMIGQPAPRRDQLPEGEPAPDEAPKPSKEDRAGVSLSDEEFALPTR